MPESKNPFRAVLASAVLAAAAVGAAAATLGGGWWPGVGPGRIVLRGSDLEPVEILANLRFDFGGSPADVSGSATVSAYDPAGQILLGEFPCTWTTGRGAAFRVDLLNGEFAGFLEDRIAAATGKEASVALDSARGRGAIVLQGEDLRLAVSASGEATLDGGPPVRLRVKMRLQ